MLPSLALRFVRAATTWTIVLVAIGLLATLNRVLPWLLHPDIPWQLSALFLRAMFLVVAEVALLLAIVASAVAVLTEMNRSGEALSWRSLGWSDSHRLLLFIVAAFPPLLIGTYVSVLAARHAQEPGRLAQDVLDEGKNACVFGKRTVAIPLLETSWLCSTPPKVAMVYRGTPLVADDAHVDATLSAIALTNVSSSVKRDGVALTFRANQLSIKGLTPFTLSLTTRPWGRAVGLFGGAWILLGGLAWFVLQHRFTRLSGTLAVVAVTALSLLLVDRWLGRMPVAPPSLFVLPAFCVAELTLIEVVRRRVPLFGRFLRHPG